MPRNPFPQKCVPLLATVVLASVLNFAAGAEAENDRLAPTRARLEALESCLGQSRAVSELRQGLLTGWRKKSRAPTLRDWPPPPPPPLEYLQSLDRDIRACQLASRLPDDQRLMVLSDVMKDIEIKAEDCHRFGMGRKVTVTITTLRGSVAENGWQVFYKWSCASALQTEEMRVPNLTSPANIDLPPGTYSIRAEKRSSSGQVLKVTPATIVVGSAQSIPVQLAIE